MVGLHKGGPAYADCSIHRLNTGQADNDGDDDDYEQRKHSNCDQDACADTYVLSTLITDPSPQQSQQCKTINQPVCVLTSYIRFHTFKGVQGLPV